MPENVSLAEALPYAMAQMLPVLVWMTDPGVGGVGPGAPEESYGQGPGRRHRGDAGAPPGVRTVCGCGRVGRVVGAGRVGLRAVAAPSRDDDHRPRGGVDDRHVDELGMGGALRGDGGLRVTRRDHRGRPGVARRFSTVRHPKLDLRKQSLSLIYTAANL